MRVRTYARVRGNVGGNGERSAIDVNEEENVIVVADPNEEHSDDGLGDASDFGSNGGSGADSFGQLSTSTRAAKRWQANRIPFDCVFGPDADQGRVFDGAVRPLLDAVLSGVNCTIFAYGQTGSGKTYTMTGRETYESRGIVPRALSVLFEDPRITRCRVSFIEVYNEVIYDLLHERQRVTMRLQAATQRRRAGSSVTLHDVEVRETVSEEDALDAFFAGNMQRSTGSTALNMSSSRSHCVFTMEVETATHVGRINFVDLAGSERTQDQTSKHINLSLHFLEQVVMDLQANKAHIGFRNSTLTALLRDSLTGNCQTAFLVTLNPEASYVAESLATCRFAQRCRCLTTRVTSNETLSQKIQRLQAENLALREDLAQALSALREHDEIGSMLRGLLENIDDNVNALVSSEIEFANKLYAQVDLEADEILINDERGATRVIPRSAVYAFGRTRVDETQAIFVLYGQPSAESSTLATPPVPPLLALQYATNGTMVEHVAWLQAFEHWLGPDVEENQGPTGAGTLKPAPATTRESAGIGAARPAHEESGPRRIAQGIHRHQRQSRQKHVSELRETHEETKFVDEGDPFTCGRNRSSSLVKRAVAIVKQKMHPYYSRNDGERAALER